MRNITIGFAGMTHLGLNSAAVAAEKGFHVICYDRNQTIAQLTKGYVPVSEPGLEELIVKNKENITYTDSQSDLNQCDIVYISTDVPTDSKGKSDLLEIKQLINQIKEQLNQDAILVILCQVPPGFTKSIDFPRERLFYQVETLIFGRAVERASTPERIIIGCSLPQNSLPEAYKQYLSQFNCPILPMDYESAEFTKIAINCYLVSSISVANTLSEICEQIGANWSDIATALKLDKRIGPSAYLKPGLGIAGGNLERDLATVTQLSNEYGTDDQVVRAWVNNSQYRKNWVLRTLHEQVLSQNPQATIGILGLTYKENTHSIKNSAAIELIPSLIPYKIKVFDPLIKEISLNHPVLTFAESAERVTQECDVLCVMTPWDQFKGLQLESLHEKIIIDPYAILNQQCTKSSSYFTLGQRHQTHKDNHQNKDHVHARAS